MMLNRKLYLVVILILFAFTAYKTQGAQNRDMDFSQLKGPYLGQMLPGMTPELFAPGIVTTNANEGCSGWGKDMEYFIFQRRINGNSRLYVMNQYNGVWSAPESLPFGAQYRVGDFTIAPDGKTMVFASRISIDEIGSESKGANIWSVEKTEAGWTKPEHIGLGINTKYHESYPCLAANGHLYFFSRRPGGYGNSDLYKSEFTEGKYQAPINLGPKLNTRYHEWDAYIAPDESYMIYCSMMPGGLGEDDLYITFKTADGSWSEPVHMGAEINTDKSENRPYVSPDGRYLFYASTKRGTRDIYWVDARIIEKLKPDKIMLKAKKIFRAIQESNVEEVKILLKDNHRLMNEIDQDKRTPLHHATQTQNIEIVRLLVECGAKINIKDSRGITPFQAAIVEQNKGIVELLIKHGADLELEDANARSPLTRVVFWTNNTEMADLLLKYGADINAVSIYDETPLSVAAWLGKREMVNFLIDKGVRIKTGGDRGKRLLIYSATRGLVRLFNELLDKGIDLFMRNDTGGNLLHSAAVGGSVEMAKILIRNNLLLDEHDRYGWTPMHYAVFRKNKDVVQLFIDEGAKLNKKTYSGKTPLHISVEAEDDDISQILISNGANRSPYKFPILEGEYLGQKLPGMIPELFVPDIISTNRMEHTSPVFSPDGKEVYWMSLIDIDGGSRHRWCIKAMRMKGKRWSKPEIASFSEDHRFNEDAPFFSANGRTLFFISNRPLPSNLENRRSKIWFVNRSDDSWSTPIPIGDVINASPTIYWQFSLSANGNLYFGGIRSDTKGQMDIYCSEYLNGKYEEPDNLIDINTQGDDVCPFIAPDESYIIFTSSGQTGGKTSPDLFISFKDDNGNWIKAQNLGEPINSTENELCPIISPDGKYLFYISIRQGNMDVYWVDAKIIEALRPRE